MTLRMWTACQKEKKANKTYRQFYRQLTFPAVTISDLQRREAPLSTCNTFTEKAGGGGSTPSLATIIPKNLVSGVGPKFRIHDPTHDCSLNPLRKQVNPVAQ